MFKERTLSALVFAPLVASAFYFGRWYFLGLIAVVALLAGREYEKLITATGVAIEPLFPVICAVVAVSGHFSGPVNLVTALAGGALILLSLSIWRRSFPSAMFALSGMTYIGGLLGCLSLLRSGEDGRAWSLIVLTATWATDVGAYLGGMAFGRHKMAPSISPGKSWEGAFSGLALSVIAEGMASGYLGISAGLGVLAGLFLSILGEMGDLLESLLKRYAQVKDSGRLMPGHGGVLDRFDSLLFTGAGGLLLRTLYRMMIIH